MHDIPTCTCVGERNGGGGIVHVVEITWGRAAAMRINVMVNNVPHASKVHLDNVFPN